MCIRDSSSSVAISGWSQQPSLEPDEDFIPDVQGFALGGHDLDPSTYDESGIHIDVFETVIVGHDRDVSRSIRTTEDCRDRHGENRIASRLALDHQSELSLI